MMKRKLGFVLAILLLTCTLFLMWGCDDESVSKEVIFQYLTDNKALLENFPYDEYQQALESDETNDGWERISRDFCCHYFGEDTIVKSVVQHEDGQILFNCGSTGIGLKNTTYSGFYYSAKGAITPDELEDLELSEITPEIYEGRSSSGRCYARHEKIAEGWYYFYEEYHYQVFFINRT